MNIVKKIGYSIGAFAFAAWLLIAIVDMSNGNFETIGDIILTLLILIVITGIIAALYFIWETE